MPSYAFPCRLSCIRGIFRYVDKMRCTFVQVFASCRRYELNIMVEIVALSLCAKRSTIEEVRADFAGKSRVIYYDRYR